jgi:WD40 repeat protein
MIAFGVLLLFLAGLDVYMGHRPAPRQLAMRSQIPLQDKLSWVEVAALSEDGKYLAMGGHKNGSFGCISLWSLATGQELATTQGLATTQRQGQWFWCMAVNPDGRMLASSREGSVQFWNAAGQSEATTLQTSLRSEVLAVAFAGDAATVAMGDGSGRISLVDAKTGQEKSILCGPTSAVRCLAFSADGRTLASGHGDGTVGLWDVTKAQEIMAFRWHTGVVRSVAFAPDGETLASGGEDRTVRLWSVSGRQLLARLSGHHGIVSSLAFAPDGKTLATGGYDSLVRIWDVPEGKLRATVEHGCTYRGMGSKVWCVGFAPDGGTLFTCGADGVVRLWDVASDR